MGGREHAGRRNGRFGCSAVPLRLPRCPLCSPTAACSLPQTQMAKGFARVEARLEDASLDQPRAPELFAQFKAQAVEQAWLAA